VRTGDDRLPDEEIKPYISEINGYVLGGVRVYLENLVFEGGQYPFVVTNIEDKRAELIVNNCEFKYSQVEGNGFSVRGNVYSIINNSSAARNGMDGFNYHNASDSPAPPIAVEINCIGRDNGMANNNDNGSSMHEEGIVIRIMGEYYNNRGPNVADVNDSSSLDMGSVMHHSKGADQANVNYYIEGKAWLDNCVLHDSTYSVSLPESDDLLYVRGTPLYDPKKVLGQILSY
jgi:hypothetical protein